MTQVSDYLYPVAMSQVLGLCTEMNAYSNVNTSNLQVPNGTIRASLNSLLYTLHVYTEIRCGFEFMCIILVLVLTEL